MSNVIQLRPMSMAEELIRSSKFYSEQREHRLPRAIKAFNEKLNSPGGCALSALMKAGHELTRNDIV